jgi:hypothetical protein
MTKILESLGRLVMMSSVIRLKCCRQKGFSKNTNSRRRKKSSIFHDPADGIADLRLSPPTNLHFKTVLKVDDYWLKDFSYLVLIIQLCRINPFLVSPFFVKKIEVLLCGLLVECLDLHPALEGYLHGDRFRRPCVFR